MLKVGYETFVYINSPAANSVYYPVAVVPLKIIVLFK